MYILLCPVLFTLIGKYTHSLSLSLSLYLSLSLSLSRKHCLIPQHNISFSLSPQHNLSLSLSTTQYLSLSRPFSLSSFLFLLSLSLSLSLIFSTHYVVVFFLILIHVMMFPKRLKGMNS